jgi:hypothetical protein
MPVGSIDVEDLRAASASFPQGTASTYDGLHPRHISLVSQEGLVAFARLLLLIEASGRLPIQLRLLVIIMRSDEVKEILLDLVRSALTFTNPNDAPVE